MGPLPPVEKLPLAARKDVRDSWENQKEAQAARISDILGDSWSIDINVLQLYAYCHEGYAKESPGSMINSYVDAAANQLKRFIERNGDEAKKEINDVCTARTLTIDIVFGEEILYNGCAVTPEGKLAILIREDRMAVNIDDAFEIEKLMKAISTAPTSTASMNFIARRSISTEWERQAESIQKSLSDILKTDITVEPGFQEIYDALNAASDAPEQWQTNLGNFTRFYFEALASALKYQKFDVDDMMQEAILEAMEKKTVRLRVVDKEQLKKSYNESVFEDGVLYMQTYPNCFGTNIDNVADGLVDLL